MNTDQKLTILLTLKDRTLYTWRWMHYANHIRCPFKILIADGGADETVSTVLSDQTHYPHVCYDYIRYPFDRTYEEWYSKVTDALSRVDTPYVVMMDNDDFFITDGLQYCVEFLDANPDYSACGGASIYFEMIASAEYGVLSGVYGEATGFRDPYPSHSNEQETALQRVQSYMHPWCPTWYHLRHTVQLRSAWAIVAELHLEELYWHERVLESLTAVEGKVATRIFPYYFRQSNAPDSLARSYYDANGNMFQRMFRDTWLRDFNNVVDSVAAAIARKDCVSEEEARSLVKPIYQQTVADDVRGALSVRGVAFIRAQFPGIFSTAIDLAWRGRNWFRSRRRAREAKSAERAWTNHLALKPMLEVLATPTVQNSTVVICIWQPQRVR